MAREAVTALQLQAAAAGGTNWVEVVQLGISGTGLAAILIGLACIKESGQRRDREIDELAGAFRKQGEAMTQAFTLQGQALERQGEMMTQALQGLRQQGEVLAELLRRPA